MDELLHRFEAPGTPAASVIDSLGQPDLVSSSDPFSSINPPLMPGLQMPTDFVPPSANPTTPGSGATAAKNSSPQQLNLIYSWRGKHDYIVFCIDESTNLVMTAGWYNAFE